MAGEPRKVRHISPLDFIPSKQRTNEGIQQRSFAIMYHLKYHSSCNVNKEVERETRMKAYRPFRKLLQQSRGGLVVS